jgi:cytochrome c5
MPPGMPPRGLCMQCSDEELAATVQFMLKVSR